ncbi:MazG-like family protein [Effusibacillus lacus]|uniref:MazG-like family protein n=1 Tax=Effusibacillus lacus TaxID=1348429 RepID=A0A292YHF3_9BACL|nr:MazG-like family protein [Effusibacillus lacus]TCS75160.1 MazG-like nucleotide pyrophosphohydrolase family protein [Effusibacillus lacus]GAX89108.1 hypothetical protein EFBL_0726 [Effusibacillus lacus]
MHDMGEKLDIAKNIKLIEWLKCELTDSLAGLFRGFHRGSEILLKECLANLVVLCYVLARRLGLRYSQFDDLIRDRIRCNAGMENEYEIWKEDLMILEQHFQQKKPQ